MAAYATVADVQARILYTLSTAEQHVCSSLLDDAAVMIDAVAPGAADDAKKLVSCRMVIRALPGGQGGGQLPVGVTQGSMSALGYQQTFTFGSGGGAGELYLGRQDLRQLGLGDRIGSYSPTENLAAPVIWEALP